MVTSTLNPAWPRRTLGAMLIAGTLWCLLGIWWGLPIDTPGFVQSSWGVDELGPHGAIAAIRAILGGKNELSPQYPLAQYFVQSVLVWPYHLWVLGADNIGFPQQFESPAVMMLLHRAPSAIMTAGTIAAAATFVRRLTANATATWLVAGLVATIGPLVYYARTSNVDAPALFWPTLALLPALDAIRHGLTLRRATILGLLAALSIATKDQQYALMLGVGVVLAWCHLSDRRTVAAHVERWRAPLASVGAAALAYAALSGVLLLPTWFAGHVRFILHGSTPNVSPEMRAQIGFYFSNPATVAGYANVVRECARLVYAALGLPALILAVVGIAVLGRRDRRVLALLLVPIVTLFAGVIAPVRFVLPRFLLPVEIHICLLAAIAVATLMQLPRWRWSGQLLAASAFLLGAVHAVDLTLQMHRDARYEAATWLEANLSTGDTLGFYASKRKLPRLRSDIVALRITGKASESAAAGAPAGESNSLPFIIILPQQTADLTHERTISDQFFDGLLDGTRGYEQVLALQTPALFPRPRLTAPSVNAPVRVFARADVARRVRQHARIEIPSPVRVP